VPQVMDAQPLHPGGSGSWDPDPAGEVAAADLATPLGREHQPVRAGLGKDAQVLGQLEVRQRGEVLQLNAERAVPVSEGSYRWRGELRLWDTKP
jgi:hypothetical protein